MFALGRDDGEMGSVDEGDHEGGDGVAAVVFGIGEDDKFVSKEFRLWCGGMCESLLWRKYGFKVNRKLTNLPGVVCVKT